MLVTPCSTKLSLSLSFSFALVFFINNKHERQSLTYTLSLTALSKDITGTNESYLISLAYQITRNFDLQLIALDFCFAFL